MSWISVITILLMGYLSMTRSFAHLGITPAHIYVGELTLAAFLFSRPRAIFDRLVRSAATPGMLHGWAIAYFVFLFYGFAQVLRGIILEHRFLTTIENFAFQIYPLFLLIGLWAGERHPTALPKIFRRLGWVNGVYGLLFIAVLSTVFILLPGTNDVPLFGQPNGSALIIMGLLSYEADLMRVAPILLINLLVMLGIQVRAEFLTLCIGLGVWAVMTRNLGRLLTGAAGVAAVLAVGFVTDFSIPAPSSRGGEISARYIIGRTLSLVDVEMASEYAPAAKSHAGTYRWRTEWWKRIWESSKEDAVTAAFGHGYGYPLSTLVSYINDLNVRTPHSIFFYCLGYQGWLGVIIFAIMQIELARMLLRKYFASGQAFGFVLWAMFLSGALFGNSFETPFGAIPFYLLCGLSLATRQAKAPISYESSLRSQLLPAAGW